jgi:broad specificity phosphatase PhoE
MLTVFFSPHSKSVDNEAGRASGHADVPLSERGRQQAQQLGEHYAKQALDVVFCSDLQRASTTAEIMFSARGVPIIKDARLREFDYGELTQHPRDEFKLEQYITKTFPGGESVFMAVQRVGEFLREVMRDYDGKTIVVIGHSATKYGLDYYSGDTPLEDLIRAEWKWLDVPIWRYEFDGTLSSR